VLFQIVSVHGALQLNIGVCDAEKKGYVGRRAEDAFSFSDEYHEVADIVLPRRSLTRRGLRHNFLFTDINEFVYQVGMHTDITVRSAYVREQYRCDLHTLIFARNPALVIQGI
jgi:hypothetical protein